MNALRAALNFLLFKRFITENYYTNIYTADSEHCRLGRGRNRLVQIFYSLFSIWKTSVELRTWVPLNTETLFALPWTLWKETQDTESVFHLSGCSGFEGLLLTTLNCCL